jgi:hypothetical protein
MSASRFIPHLASEQFLWAYFLDERKRTREQVYSFIASFELGGNLAHSSTLIGPLVEWFRKDKGGLMSQKSQERTKVAAGSLVGRHIRVADKHLPPVLREAFQPLLQLEQLAILLGDLQQRIGRLLDELAKKPTLQLFLKSMGEKQAMAAFADFAAETQGIQPLTNRELAALSILGGYEEFTDSQEETEKRIEKWADVHGNSKWLLEALRQLAGRTPAHGAPEASDRAGGGGGDTERK